MPIPKPPAVGGKAADMQYMSFADVQVLPFTNVHVPSLAATPLRLANAINKKHVIAASKLRVTTVVSSLANKATVRY